MISAVATLVFRSLIILLLLVALCAGIVWWQLPRFIATEVASLLSGYGWSLESLELERPSGPRLHIAQMTASREDVTVTTTDIDIMPLPGLDAFVRVGNVSIHAGAGASTAETSWQQIVDLVPAALSVPAAAGEIEHFEGCAEDCLSGSAVWHRDSRGMGLSFKVSPVTGRYLQGDADIRPGRAEATLIVPASAIAHIDSNWNGKGRVSLDGGIDFRAPGQPVRFETETPYRFAIDLTSLSATLDASVPLASDVNLTAIQQDLQANLKLSTATSWMMQRGDLTLAGNEPWHLSAEYGPSRRELRLDRDVTVTVTGTSLKLAHFTLGRSAACEIRTSGIDCRLPRLALTGLTAENTELLATLNVTHLTLENQKPAAVATGQFIMREQGRELVTSPIDAALDDDRLHLSTKKAAMLGLSPVTLDITHNIDTQQGSANLDWSGPATGLRAIARQAGIEGLDIQSGHASASAQLAFDLTKPNLLEQIQDFSGVLSGSDWHISYSNIELQGGKFSAALEGWPSIRSTAPAALSWREIDIGVPVEDISLTFDAHINPIRGQYAIRGHSFDSRSLGGRLSSRDFAYDIADRTGHMNLDLDSLQLDHILALEKEEFETTGSISGSVPVQIANGKLTIENGSIAAAPPGGVIKYKPGQSVKSMIEGNEQMKLVIDALSNFQYNALTSELDYTPDGKLIAHTSIRGNNPSYQQGREIHFNLNLEENVGTLLESLRLSNEVERRLQERVRQEHTQ